MKATLASSKQRLQQLITVGEESLAATTERGRIMREQIDDQRALASALRVLANEATAQPEDVSQARVVMTRLGTQAMMQFETEETEGETRRDSHHQSV